MRQRFGIDGWELDQTESEWDADARATKRAIRRARRFRRMYLVYYFLAIIGGAMGLFRLLPDETRQAIFDTYVAPALGIGQR